MNKFLFRLPVLALLIATTIIGCVKENGDGSFDSEAAAQSQDQSNFSEQIDAVSSDAELILEANVSFAGRNVIAGVCNATYEMDTLSNPRTITITYNGNNCAGTHHRTGTVVISMPANTRWRNAGAVLTFTYTNLKVKRLSDNKSITINGSHQLTNVTGGILINLPQLNNITHTITSHGMTVQFDDHTQRNWQVARQRVFTYHNGIVVTVTGMHTDGNQTGIAEWGTNRFGRPFTSAITQPLVFRQDCPFRLVSGQIKHTVPVFTATGTFGLDASGNPTTCPGNGHFFCKVVWVGLANNTHTVIFPY